ncbi:MAG: N-6 DNA methylase [Coriobacteriia bacterium]|nr:N-6 DNA methylase [Coriobacteriia bacterium]MCL2746408.1 N-6 DNA methylase [Coriobacteriia bacterium]
MSSVVVDNYSFRSREEVLKYIELNPEKLGLEELTKIAEMANCNKQNSAAFYTENATLMDISARLPEINEDTVRVLEPSAGVGNFLQLIVDHYSNSRKLIIDLVDIDEMSLKLLVALNKYRKIPDNVEINCICSDFLLTDFSHTYDLVIGNPPFLRLNKAERRRYESALGGESTKNTAGFFLTKAISIADYCVFVMPKYFLSNSDFSESRKNVERHAVQCIIDFGETGFRGVLIETVALFICTRSELGVTTVYSVPRVEKIEQMQKNIMSHEFPGWLIYRNDTFDELVARMELGVFSVFRDRQITNKVLSRAGEIRVIRSRNIARDGSGLVDVCDYDRFINESDLKRMPVGEYLDRDDVYLCPNMTYYPRVIRKPKGVVPNGSVAILERLRPMCISDEQLDFFASKAFENYYRIARNHSTRSLNIDSSSVYFFGLLKNAVDYHNRR